MAKDTRLSGFKTLALSSVWPLKAQNSALDTWATTCRLMQSQQPMPLQSGFKCQNTYLMEITWEPSPPLDMARNIHR